MKNKTLLIVMAAIVVLAILAFTAIYFVNKNKTTPTTKLEACNIEQDQFAQDSCYSETALTKQDPSICSKIQDRATKSDCYIDIALTKQDLSICDEIQDQRSKDDCYWGFAKAKQDLTICDKIQIQMAKNDCYKYINQQ